MNDRTTDRTTRRTRHLPVPFDAVTLHDTLWQPRQRAVREHTVPFLHAQYEKNGLFEALDVDSPPGPLRIPFNGRPNTAVMYWDSDIAKWIETASYTLAKRFDPALDARIDDLIARIAKAQRPDGYFNTYFIRREPAKRWTNLRDWHELYNAGHLIEAAIAHARATGKSSLVEVVCKYADHIDRAFGPRPGQRRGYCGHPEIELALVKLHHHTGEPRYLDLAKYFIDERGRQPHYFDREAIERGEDPAAQYYGTYEYSQSHIPVREQRQVVGHAVRAMYLYCAMADLGGELADASLGEACKTLWTDVTTRRLYVTGGLGPSERNEGFTADYDLPNETAYAETCAAVGLIFWAHRMVLAERDAQYADVMELALYNGALAGLALDGEHFFYDNPLASRGNHRRWTWHRCPCCPPNIGRLIASLGQYICSTGADEVAVHLYIASEARVDLDGKAVVLTQTTNYPWSGAVTVAVAPEAPAEFALRLRVPGWCRGVTLAVNGVPLDIGPLMDRGYAQIRRTWQAGDTVAIVFEMPPERIYANPEVAADAGRVALKRGPVVYCLEGVDNAAALHRVALPRDNPIESRYDTDLMSGVGTLEVTGMQTQAWPADALYRRDAPELEPVRLRAIPYSFWSNRAADAMTVWVREV